MARPRGQNFADADVGRPLTDREKQQIVRLLSEPMEFPMSYRTWVKNYIETVGVQLPRSAIVGLNSSTTRIARGVVAESLPPGTLLLGLWREPPKGTVFTDGATLTREEFPQLAEALGINPIHDEFELPRIFAPDGQRYALVTGNRPLTVRESED